MTRSRTPTMSTMRPFSTTTVAGKNAPSIHVRAARMTCRFRMLRVLRSCATVLPLPSAAGVPRIGAVIVRVSASPTCVTGGGVRVSGL